MGIQKKLRESSGKNAGRKTSKKLHKTIVKVKIDGRKRRKNEKNIK